jgi:hypothetical protein
MAVQEPHATGTEDRPEGFAELGLDEQLLSCLSKLGYEEPTPIQREAIPPHSGSPPPGAPRARNGERPAGLPPEATLGLVPSLQAAAVADSVAVELELGQHPVMI